MATITAHLFNSSAPKEWRKEIKRRALRAARFLDFKPSTKGLLREAFQAESINSVLRNKMNVGKNYVRKGGKDCFAWFGSESVPRKDKA